MAQKTSQNKTSKSSKSAYSRARTEAAKIKQEDRAKTAAKSTKTNNTQRQPRAKTAADTLYNIKRRYRRAAERNEKAAMRAEAAGDMVQARELRATAKAARVIAGGFSSNYLKSLGMSPEQRAREIQRIIATEDRASLEQLASYQSKSEEARRRSIANTIMKAGAQSVVYAATKKLWQGEAPSDRDEAIIRGLREMGFADVNDMLDVLNVLEDMGINVLEPTDDADYYLRNSRLGMLMMARAAA